MRRLTKEEVRAAISDGREAGYELRPQVPLNAYARAALNAHRAGDLPERRRAGTLARVWQLAYYKGRDARVAELERLFELSPSTTCEARIAAAGESVVLRCWITVDGEIHQRDR